MFPEIKIVDFTYDLPDERIARFPMEKRDNAKLLTYIGGAIGQTVFAKLPDLLPEQALLVFNETKVIPARLFFQKYTGALIELFCLEPLCPADYEQCFAATSSCTWKCIAGNSKRWKGGILRSACKDSSLSAELLEKHSEYVVVKFVWDGCQSFSQVLEQCGATPIPPYLKRDATGEDTTRYQTVYARYQGSVAAPTAGLHFTPDVLTHIEKRGIATEKITLHVGAGTFRPVKSETIADHTMHSEPFVVTRKALQAIIRHLGNIIAVGTTSTRTLESLYYLGLQCIEGKIPQTVSQWEPYTINNGVPVGEALQALLKYMEKNGLQSVAATTQIIIAPPYRFKIIRGLITNFHQPQSTLLLLIGALIGNNWHNVYNYALANNFRFLSYGDSSLLIP